MNTFPGSTFPGGDVNIGYYHLLLPFDVESYQESSKEIADRATLVGPLER